MNDHHDQPLGGSPATPDAHPLGTAVNGHQHDEFQVLTLDEIMTQARLVERTARICLRGDIDDELNQLVTELAGLVDDDGQPLDEDDKDPALGHPSGIQQRYTRIRELRAERAKWMRTVRFQAMPDDEFRLFEKENRDKDGELKDGYYDKLIARCAIAPRMSVDDVRAMRKKFGSPQMTALGNAAYLACATGGLDVPKSPSFLAALERQQHDKS